MAVVRITMRRDTAANWTSANPILFAGEIGVETDTLKVKVGNGTSNWAALPYIDNTPRATTAPPAVGTAAVGSSSSVARADHSHALPASPSFTTITASGNATVGGDLLVSGSILGGSHTHLAAAITDINDKIYDRMTEVLINGAGLSLTSNDQAGTLTFAVSGNLDGGTYTGTLA